MGVADIININTLRKHLRILTHKEFLQLEGRTLGLVEPKEPATDETIMELQALASGLMDASEDTGME